MEDRPVVVVADDNESLRYLLVHALRAHPDMARLDLKETAHGLAALDVIERAVRDGRRVLALSDHRMPGLDGEELARRVGTHIASGRVRFVLLTASEPPARIRERAEAAGASVVERPTHLAELRTLVQRVLAEWPVIPTAA